MRQRLTGALMMAVAIGALLAIQYLRGSWPFTAERAVAADKNRTGGGECDARMHGGSRSG